MNLYLQDVFYDFVIITAISRYYFLLNMSGNLCNTIVTAILNQTLAYLRLEWYNLYCAFKN